MTAWPDVLAAALVGTARSGGSAGALLDRAAELALRRRAGVALVPVDERPGPVPRDDGPTVGPAATARVDALLALDQGTRGALPVKDMAGRLELLTEWLATAAECGRRVPPELVPALLDAARRHRDLRPHVAATGGPLAAWLGAQRPEWAFATALKPPPPAEEDPEVWELGPAAARVGYLRRLRRRDPARGRELLAASWSGEAPDDRVPLLESLAIGLGPADEPLLEHALDDRRKQVRDTALDLVARLPDTAYSRRMADRAHDAVQTADVRVAVRPPAACDRDMRRDGIVARPPAGTGERAWWLEEILARAPLSVWPADLLDRPAPDQWQPTLRRGLARAAAAQRDPRWAARLVDGLADEAVTHGRPDDRLLVEALYDALPADDLTVRAAAALNKGLAEATAAGVDHVLALLPRPWPAGVADAVFAAIETQFSKRGGGWRVAALGELAALRLPADLAPRAAALIERHQEILPTDPRGAAIGRFASVLRYRHEMIQELTT